LRAGLQCSRTEPRLLQANPPAMRSPAAAGSSFPVPKPAGDRVESATLGGAVGCSVRRSFPRLLRPRSKGAAPARKKHRKVGTIGRPGCFTIIEKQPVDGESPVARNRIEAFRDPFRDDHEAQDAFQATFLILVRKAGSLWIRDSLGPWLHRVACRVAVRARIGADRRRAVERQAAEAATRSTTRPPQPQDAEDARNPMRN
jgi:hypothetical protein